MVAKHSFVLRKLASFAVETKNRIWKNHVLVGRVLEGSKGLQRYNAMSHFEQLCKACIQSVLSTLFNPVQGVLRSVVKPSKCRIGP